MNAPLRSEHARTARAQSARANMALLIAGVLASALSAHAAPPRYALRVAADAPVAWYRLNEAAISAPALDASGNGFAAVYSAAGVSPSQPGLFAGGGAGPDSAARFTGGRLTVANAAALNPDRITLEAVVRWDGPNGFLQRVIEKSFVSDGSQSLYALCVANDGRVVFEVRSTGPTTLTGVTALAVGQEAHLVATFDAPTLRIYINGVLDAQVASPNPNALGSSSHPLGIGNQALRNRPFNGVIDEAVVFDLALPAQRILAHHHGLTGQMPCPADLNDDGNLNSDDLSDAIACYFDSGCHFDINVDGRTDPDDLSDYIAAYFGGCP